MNPCYDPSRFAKEWWEGTALDVLKAKQVPGQDRLWVVTNESWVDKRTLRLFAIWCARRTLARQETPNQKGVEACDLAERYANDSGEEESKFTQARVDWMARYYETEKIIDFVTSDVLKADAGLAAFSSAVHSAFLAGRIPSDTGYVVSNPAQSVAKWEEELAAQIAHFIEMLEE
jgi:hypothetical protein